MRRAVLAALLAALSFALYANGYHHEFVLDDAYTVVSNTNVRSLANIPRYFVDPGTYTSFTEQAEYRPLVQTTFALNYAMGGYAMWWWHFTQVLLHAAVTVGIFLLARRILVLLRAPSLDGPAFAVALIFAIHPGASGVVMYINARSSLLTAAFLLPAFLAYLRSVDTPRFPRPQWGAALFLALALWSKVEAIGALGAFWAFELWQRQREQPDNSLLQSFVGAFDGRTLRRMAPALAVVAIYTLVRWRVMAPFPFAEARAAADVGAYEYLGTQFTAWWYYAAHFVAPVRLIADHLAYPVYRSWLEPVVLLALAGWTIVATLLIASWRRAPYLLAFAIAALALLSPTSSIAPLAEMVNEHRPYLPLGVLSAALFAPLAVHAQAALAPRARIAVIAGAATASLALAALTWQRNGVFATGRTYWADVLAKAPSSRAYMNYGLALMREADFDGAIQNYDRSLELAPNWFFTHINRGIALQHLRQTDAALAAFDKAVALDRFSGLALTWRAEFKLEQGDLAGARADLTAASAVALHRYRLAKDFALLAARSGDAAGLQRHAVEMRTLDPIAAATDLQAISATVALAGGTSNEQRQGDLMRAGLASLQRADNATAAQRFREVIAINSTHYGAHYQLAVALDRLGRAGESRPVWERVLRMAQEYADEPTARTARERLARNR